MAAMAIPLCLASLVIASAMRFEDHEKLVQCSKLPEGKDSLLREIMNSKTCDSNKRYFSYNKRTNRYQVIKFYGCFPEWQHHLVCSRYDRSFREFVAKEVHLSCKKELCDYARTGNWKAGFWSYKQKKAVGMPWHARKHGHASYGYQDVFDMKCWKGPEGFGNMLPDFTEFAASESLITKDETFNKKACGCRTEDDCSRDP